MKTVNETTLNQNFILCVYKQFLCSDKMSIVQAAYLNVAYCPLE